MAHPVAKITRLGNEGYGVQRNKANAFANKTSGTIVTSTASNTWHAHGGFGRHSVHGKSGKGYSA
jgi:hypothetical protein